MECTPLAGNLKFGEAFRLSVRLRINHQQHRPEPVTDLEVMTRKWKEWCESHGSAVPLERIPHLLAALVKDEREACAVFVEKYDDEFEQFCAELAVALRARENKQLSPDV